MATYESWIQDGQPVRYARPIAQLRNTLRAHGYTVYDLGNEGHLTHEPPEDHTPFSATGWPSPAPYPYVNAIDIMPPRAGMLSRIIGAPLPSLQRLARQIRADKINGVDGAEFLKYINWEPDGDYTGSCYHDSWTPDYARRTSSDRGHIHISGRSDTISSTKTDDYDPVLRILEGEDMPLSGSADKAFIQDAVRDLIVSDADPVAKVLQRRPWQYAGNGLQGATSTLDALSDSQLVLAAVVDLTALVRAVHEISADELAAALAPLIVIPEGNVTADEVEQRIRKVLGSVDNAETPTV